MRQEMWAHRTRQRRMGLWLILLSLASLGLAAYLVEAQDALAGMSPHLVALALPEQAVGALLFLRAPKARMRLAVHLVEDPAGFQAEERRRLPRARAFARTAIALPSALLAVGVLLLAMGERAAGSALLLHGSVLVPMGVRWMRSLHAYGGALGRFLHPDHAPPAAPDLGE